MLIKLLIKILPLFLLIPSFLLHTPTLVHETRSLATPPTLLFITHITTLYY